MLFEEDAFISYAHLDNVELVEGRKGWVANLHRALEVRVAQLLGKPPHIWRDPKLSGNDMFAETLVDHLKRAAILITIISPRYLKSEWTLRELNEFWHAAEAQGGIHVRNKARVFKVLKTPVSLDRTPAELRTLIGYEFFKVDPETGKIRELDEIFGPDAHRDFWIRLDDLAHDICDLLEAMEGGNGNDASPPQTVAAPVPPRPSTTPGAIFLAETTNALKEQLKRDLRQHGYIVLPDHMLPHVAEEARAAIREDLSRCRMSIHLIGKNYSVVPEGGVESLIEIQHELATERAQHGEFSRLLWIPSGQKVDDERQQKVVERLRLDPRIKENADLLETFFEDLRSLMQEWLTRERTPAAAPAAAAAGGAARRVYLIADQRDAELITPWADALFEQDLEVIRPIFDGDEAEIREYHEDSLSTCDGVLIFYGAANELWLRRKLREVQKSAGYGRTKPSPIVGICLVAPRTPEKERFRTHEALVAPQWEGVSPDSLSPFIAHLKAGRVV
jgi:TIR domain-containing protein